MSARLRDLLSRNKDDESDEEEESRSSRIDRSAVIHYKFENFISQGGKNIFTSLVALFIICYLFTLVIRIILIFAYGGLDDADPNKNNQDTWWGHLYVIFLEMTDPGNMNQDILTAGGMKFPAIVGGILGVIIFSMLIAFITTSLDQLLAELKKGHSKVLETDQTLILGWNERVIDICKELIIANESEKYASVVILADKEKEWMDDEILSSIHDPQTTRIITRSGTTSSLTNLARVNAVHAKSAIVLASCSDGATEEEKQISDSTVVKTILALEKCQEGENEINMVAEIFSEAKRNLIEFFDSDLIQSVDTNEILGKILVQTSRTSGLAIVYNEVISFDGSELYFFEADWGGRKFYDIIYHWPDGVPLGVKKADGRLLVRPEDQDEIMEEGDEVLILAEDDSTIEFMPEPVAQPQDLPFEWERLEQRVERELILGWHATAPIIIGEFSEYLKDGSHIDIMIRDPSDDMKKVVDELHDEHDSLNINIIEKNPVDLDHLMDQNPFSYDNVIILSMNEGENHPETVDSETITILLLLRRIFKEHGQKEGQTTKIITQVMNSENQELMAKTDVDDFVISNKMISMIFAQLSEEGEIRRVYDDLFQEDGSEIYLKPANLYFQELPAEITFATMMGQAHKREEICLGIREGRHAADEGRNFGITLIPEKNTVYTLTEEDSLVVLAEDEL